MTKVLVDSEKLINIANAIREKNGETKSYYVHEMGTAIQNIIAGNGDDVTLYNIPITHYCPEGSDYGIQKIVYITLGDNQKLLGKVQWSMEGSINYPTTIGSPVIHTLNNVVCPSVISIYAPGCYPSVTGEIETLWSQYGDMLIAVYGEGTITVVPSG